MILEDERRWRLDDPNHIEEEHNNCQETTRKGGTVDPVAGLPGGVSKVGKEPCHVFRLFPLLGCKL